MKAIDFLNEYNRMCRNFTDCKGCPLKADNSIYFVCDDMIFKEPQKYIEIVKEWSEKNAGPDTKY